MKLLKNFAVVALLFVFSVLSIAAASGVKWYANQTIKFTWNTGWDFSGDYITGTGVGYGKEKQVYVRMGNDATLSPYVSSSTLMVSATDYGPFGAIGDFDYSAYLNVR